MFPAGGAIGFDTLARLGLLSCRFLVAQWLPVLSPLVEVAVAGTPSTGDARRSGVAEGVVLAEAIPVEKINFRGRCFRDEVQEPSGPNWVFAVTYPLLRHGSSLGADAHPDFTKTPPSEHGIKPRAGASQVALLPLEVCHSARRTTCRRSDRTSARASTSSRTSV